MKELNNYILYCSNLDDNEYNLLWEYYNEQSFLNKIKEDFSYLFFTLFIWKISTKDYLTKRLCTGWKRRMQSVKKNQA